MSINLPSKVRAALYIFTAIGSLVVTYLAATSVISAPEVALWTGFTVFVSGLARINVTPDVQ